MATTIGVDGSSDRGWLAFKINQINCVAVPQREFDGSPTKCHYADSVLLTRSKVSGADGDRLHPKKRQHLARRYATTETDIAGKKGD